MRAVVVTLLAAPIALTFASCGGDEPCTAPPDVSGLDFASARKQLASLSKLCVIDPPTVAGSGRPEPKNGTVPYDLTSPLFSDYATKFRTIWIPPGKKIEYSATDTMKFPVGTIITKTFGFPADARTPQQNVKIIETRVLIQTSTGWLALPYVWNAAQTDASIDILGSVYSEPFIDANGTTQTPTYLIPSTNQCLLCHEGTESAQPIGPKAGLLNKPSPYLPGAPNQLDYLTTIGWLSGAPASASAPKYPAYDDPNAGTLDQRARSWLDANCAHCHSEKGGARTTGLYLTYGETDPFKVGFCKPPVAAGSGTGGRKYDIVPGQPDASIIPFRLESTMPSTMMPPVGRSLVHTASVGLIKEWIASLTGTCN